MCIGIHSMQEKHYQHSQMELRWSTKGILHVTNQIKMTTRQQWGGVPPPPPPLRRASNVYWERFSPTATRIPITELYSEFY